MLSGNSNGCNHKSIISEGVEIEGDIHFTGPVAIYGKVLGSIVSEEIPTIGKTGDVRSDIKARDIVISGRLEGDVKATGLIEITSTGKFTGNLYQEHAMLRVEKGGIFNGKSIIKENETGFKKTPEIKQVLRIASAS